MVFSYAYDKLSQEDVRARVFERVLEWAAHMIKDGNLLFAVLENVKGVLQRMKGQPSFMERVLAVLREEIPEFQWEVQTLAATDYKLPQTRVRVFLTGVRSSFCGGIVPRCLPPFGKSTLREFVAEGLPNTPRTELTGIMAVNLRTIEQKVQAGIKSGVVPADALIIAPIDRAEGKAYKQRYLVNVAPTLTCHNKYLFLLSAADIMTTSTTTGGKRRLTTAKLAH